MRLTTLAAKNYRTLEDVVFNFGRSYCTISGRNNAGKSSLIRLILALFGKEDSSPYYPESNTISYGEDKTQWAKSEESIKVSYELELTEKDDPALLRFIEKIAATKLGADTIQLKVDFDVAETGESKPIGQISGRPIDDQAAREIVAKLRSSNLVFLYNSTTRTERYYWGAGKHRFLYDFSMSPEESTAMNEAGKHVQRKLKKLAREHTEELNKMLGRLSDRYDVEFSPLEGAYARTLPISINLKDKHVTVPLNDWGSGTQNRTHILMAMLKANRIRASESSESRITPIVVIEEPESFLHPSAQAEFGRILKTIADETGIQVLVTSHSPYMLNQQEPIANILLGRDIRRGQLGATRVVSTTADKWMTPFAEQLGVAAAEFPNWRPLFSTYKQCVLLVEGTTDQEYFKVLQTCDLGIEKLCANIEVVPYGGKDTLKNTLLVRFVLGKFDEVFVTFDLDADAECCAALERVGLARGRDFLALGRSDPGQDAIEGLLPKDVLAAVNGRETDLVMAVRSKDNKIRREAKDELKKKYLAEFQSRSAFAPGELRSLEVVVKKINARFARGNR